MFEGLKKTEQDVIPKVERPEDRQELEELCRQVRVAMGSGDRKKMEDASAQLNDYLPVVYGASAVFVAMSHAGMHAPGVLVRLASRTRPSGSRHPATARVGARPDPELARRLPRFLRFGSIQEGVFCLHG